MLSILLKGFIIGLSIAMPIGPIAMFLIRNTLERGFKFGFAVGLGAALIEGIYSFIAASGFVIIAKFLDSYLVQIKVVSALLLILLGFFEIYSSKKSSNKEIAIKESGFLKTVIFVALFTAANPLTIVFFTGVFATISSSNFNFIGAILISLGAFFGSLVWTIFLSKLVAKMRHKISTKWIRIIRIISGFVIALFGFYGIYQII
ncbi:MAG: hypothetical protein FJ368_02905 [Pelagibacterales bacterium]|nr:hypothetical protein [Pelagibacterales bacterium]